MRHPVLSLLAITTILVLAVTGQPAQAACETPLGTRNEGTIIYNADHKVAQLCTGTEWVALNGGFSSGGSGSGGSTMVDGWPDAIQCYGSTGNVTLYNSYGTQGGGRTYVSGYTAGAANQNLIVQFNSAGTWVAVYNTGAFTNYYETNCNGSANTIATLYTDGKAFNFIGGGSGGSADNLGNHTATQNLDLASYKLVGEGGTEGITIDDAGNVGIGTTAPMEPLHIGGTNRIFLGSDGANRKGLLFDSHTGLNYSRIHSYDYENGTSRNLVLNPFGGGNVGIGTDSPSARLHVNSNGITFNPPALTYAHGQVLLGNIATSNYSANGIAFTNQSGGTGWRYVAANSDSLFFGSSSTGVLGHFTNAGNFYVTGNGYAPSWVNTSDARLKRNVEALSYGLDTIGRLNPVTFDWIDEELRAENGRQVGFIAQEVEAFAPELITTADDEMRTKSMAYGQMTAILTKAVQELKAENDNLRAENAAQDEKIEALISDIEGLRAAISQ